jgi:hypothetical protein
MPDLISNQKLPRHWILFVLLVAVLLRIIGIGYGQPFWLANDELPLVGGALRMIELHNPIPSFNPGPMSILYYPPGLPWLYLVIWTPQIALQWIFFGLPPLQIFSDRLLSDLTSIWTTARLVSAAFSVATVWVVMRLTAEALKDRVAALIAGLLMATSFHHGMLGHFARVWPSTIFFFWWGLWATWRIYEQGTKRDYIWAALAAGFGFAVNFVGVLISFGAALAHIARHRRLVVDRPILVHAVIVAIFIAVVAAASWNDILRLMGFSSFLAKIPGVSDQHGVLQVGYLLEYYFFTLLKSDALLVAAGLVGLPLLLRKAPFLVCLFFVVFAPYWTMILTGYANDDRYILPLTPIFAIAGGSLAMVSWPAWRRAALAVLVAIIVVQGALLGQLEYLMMRPDTRMLARGWMQEDVPANEGVIDALRSVTFEQTLRAVELERDLAPGAISYLQRRRLAGVKLSSGGGGRQLDAVNIRQIGPEALQTRSPEQLLQLLISAGYRWFVADDLSGPVGDGQFEKLLLSRARLIETINPGSDIHFGPVFNLTDQFERGASFDLFRLQHLGPVVKIYRFD